jgi:hypothetical protein
MSAGEEGSLQLVASCLTFSNCVTNLTCHSFELVSSPRYEDYEIEYDSNNVWSWLGNGFSTRDLDGRDLTKHMGLLDGLDRQIDYDV